jgi:hypothetical protein
MPLIGWHASHEQIGLTGMFPGRLSVRLLATAVSEATARRRGLRA